MNKFISTSVDVCSNSVLFFCTFVLGHVLFFFHAPLICFFLSSLPISPPSRGAAGLPRAHQGPASKDCGIHAAHESHQPEGHARPAGNDVIELFHALVIYLVRKE